MPEIPQVARFLAEHPANAGQIGGVFLSGLAPQAAGKIHTDFERGFIRAEVVSYKALTEFGSMLAAKEKGQVRSEGKEYIMQDGDVVLFRFNV